MASGDEIERAQAQLEQRRREQAERAARKVGGTVPVGDALAGAVERERAPSGYAAILRALSSNDPEERQRARFAVAEDTRRNLHRFKRRAIPTCPVRLPSESVLLAILRKRGKKRAASDRGTVQLFVRWRDAVMRAEHTNEATLRALFEAVTTFRALELPDFTTQILEHLEVEFEIHDVPAERGAWDLAARTKDFDTLSIALRRGERSRTKKPEAHPEDDDTALRGGVEIPPPGSKPDDFDPDDDFDVPDFP